MRNGRRRYKPMLRVRVRNACFWRGSSLDGGSRVRKVRHRPTAWRADGVAVRVPFCHFQAMSRKRATSRSADPFPSKSASSGDAAPRRYALRADLGAALKYLDDAQFDALLSSVTAEARRRGRPSGVGAVAPERSGVKKSPAGGLATGSKAKDRPVSLPPGQQRIIQAAFEAGVKPAAIARQFRLSRVRLSRAQVDRIIGAAQRSARRPARAVIRAMGKLVSCSRGTAAGRRRARQGFGKGIHARDWYSARRFNVDWCANPLRSLDSGGSNFGSDSISMQSPQAAATRRARTSGA